MSAEKIDFGLQQVTKEKKQRLVHDVFESVASRYDLMNDFMSFGLHRIWKKKFINLINPDEGSKLLDLAGGSGDISFAYLKKAKRKNIQVKCVLSDINEHMLKTAKNRAIDNNVDLDSLGFQIINAEQIPFEDSSFDFCTIAFGIRNVTDKLKALREIRRVLKPGGKFLCLEFSQLNNEIMQRVYDEYSFKVIPKLGKLVADDEDSYQYLVESIRQFPDAENFEKMLIETGFENTKYEALTHGVVAIHTGWKI